MKLCFAFGACFFLAASPLSFAQSDKDIAPLDAPSEKTPDKPSAKSTDKDTSAQASDDKGSDATTKAKSSTNMASGPKHVFLKLLKDYKFYPKEFFKRARESDNLNIDPKSLERIDYSVVERLSPTVLAARFREYNVQYQQYKALETQIGQQLSALEKRKKNTPITNYGESKEIELKIAALNGKYDQARYIVFMMSVNANMSLLSALETLKADDHAKDAGKTVVAKAPKEGPPPKLPGTYQGSEADRRKLRESDKMNLTPVDPEFYNTQLGKKLESDLKGRADFWSYDYGADELYVKVDNEIAKVNVFQDSGGVRFIRTRMGSSFSEARNPDLKIDSVEAKGRFLTGDKREETLFGKMPPTGPKVLEEGPAGHSKDQKHDH